MLGATRELLIKITGANRDALKKLDTTAKKVNAVGRRIGRTARNVVRLTARIGVGVAALGTGAFLAGRKILNVGARVEETANKFRTVFGPATAQASRFLDDFARKAGLTVQESQELMASAGGLAQGFGFAQKESADLSKQILKTAGDLASFHNVPIERTAEAITSALAGEREQLKKLDIVLRQSDVNHRALVNTGKKAVDALTDQEKATASLKLIMEKAGVAIGDLDRTQGSAANTARRLGRDFRQIGQDVAVSLLPALEEVMGFLDENRGALLNFIRNSVSGAIRMISGFVRWVVKTHHEVADTFIGKIFGMEGKGRELAAADERLEKLKSLREDLERGVARGNLGPRLAAAGLSPEADLEAVTAAIEQQRKKIDAPGGLTDAFTRWEQSTDRLLGNLRELEKRLTRGIGRVGTGVTPSAEGGEQEGPGDIQVQAAGELTAKTIGMNLAPATREMEQTVEPQLKSSVGDIIGSLSSWVGGQAKSVGQSLIMGIMSGSGDMGQTLKRFMFSIASKFIMGALTGGLGIFSPSKKARREVGRPLVDGIIRGIRDRTPDLARAMHDVSRVALGHRVPGVAMPSVGTPAMASPGALPPVEVEGVPEAGEFTALSEAALASDRNLQRVVRFVLDLAHDDGYRPGRGSR